MGPGDTLAGRYAIEYLVGEGTFGWVFSAMDVLESKPRRVALKVLRQRYSTQPEVVRRFERRELALLLRVQKLAPTPHVVRALEDRVLVHEGLPYLVLEFIEGPSLREVMDEQPLEISDIQRLGAELARGLAAIHSVGGVHRDLKPANIRLRGGRQPVIVDLGINRALWDTQEFTETGQVFMTPRYASPEQGVRLNVGPASDVYSLGLILYELLTGEVPHEGEDIKAALASRQVKGPSHSQNSGHPLPRALRVCVLRCLHQNPRRRPKASEVAVSLSPEESGWSRLGARTRWGLGLVGIAVVIVLGMNVKLSIFGPPQGYKSPTAHPGDWSRSFTYPTKLRSIGMIKSNDKNNVLIMGGFNGVMNFGGTILEQKKNSGIFVVKLGPGGVPGWSRRLSNGSDWQWPGGIGVGPDGDVWIQGQFKGTIDPGPGCQELVSTGIDGFLARLNDEGRCLWIQRLGGDGDQIPDRLVTTPDGDVVVAGNFNGQLKIGDETLISEGPLDYFVARFSAEGAMRWVIHFKSQKQIKLGSLMLGSTGSIRMMGDFKDGIDLNGVVLKGDSTLTQFAAIFDKSGRYVWSKRLDCEFGGNVVGETCTLGEDGSSLLLKSVPSVDAPYTQDAFLTQLNADGTTRWMKKIGSFEKRRLWGLFTAHDGRILVAAEVEGGVDLGDGPYWGVGGQDILLLEFTPTGDWISARRFSNGLGLNLDFATIDGNDDWMLLGDFTGELGLGSARLTSGEGRSLFVAHLQHQSGAPTARVAADTACLPAPPGLVAGYSFESLGIEAPSSVERASQGPLRGGARLVPGRNGMVLFPNGGFFQAPDTAALDLGRGSFSLSAWIRTSDAEQLKIIVDKRNEPVDAGPIVGYQLGLDSGVVLFGIGDGQGIGSCSAYDGYSCTNYNSGRFVADGAWHLVSVTVERNEPMGGTIYVDGEVVSRFNTTTHTGSIDTDQPLRIGSRSTRESGLFRGLIDDVTLWRRALSPKEVVALYQVGSKGMCRSPLPDAGNPPDAGR